MGHDAHSHHSDARSLRVALALILTFMLGEVVVAVGAHSLALLADAGHMLTDALALGASLWAARLSTRPAEGKWTFGFVRAEILSAALNGITLLVVGGIILVEAVTRLVHPVSVGGGAVIAVATVGVVVNLLAAWTLSRGARASLNVEGAFRHILTDLYAFLATIVAGVVIVTTGYARADAIASLVVVILMAKASWSLLHASGRILLEVAPENVNLDTVREHLRGLAHVLDVHDLHVWTVTSGLPVLSAHVVIDETCFSDGLVPTILDQLQSCLAGHFDVEHSTFQVEPPRHLDHETRTH